MPLPRPLMSPMQAKGPETQASPASTCLSLEQTQSFKESASCLL